MKRFPVPAMILIAALLAACDYGVQRGQFAVGGDTSQPVSGMAGELMIIRGDPLPLTPASNGLQPLMYILVIAPGFSVSGEGSRAVNDFYASAYYWNYTTAQGPVEMQLTWNRQTDEVFAGGSRFDRKKGNAFVLIRDPAGQVAATQVGPINAGLDKLAALQQIQVALPAASVAKSVTLGP
jgi:hypothetical protein